MQNLRYQKIFMKYNGKENHSFTQQMQIGAAIGKMLHPIATREAVGRQLGISDEAVRKIENRALYKLALRLTQNENQEP